jgi:hypothetical protein
MPLKNIDRIFQSLLGHPSGATLIVCFFTGPKLPDRCAPMLRHPAPPIDRPFDTTFPRLLAEAAGVNPAVHDGAIMVGRSAAEQGYRIAGWSFRLFPGPVPDMLPNRGSAFNSAHAMSGMSAVDAVYWLSGVELFRFNDGHGHRLSR